MHHQTDVIKRAKQYLNDIDDLEFFISKHYRLIIEKDSSKSTIINQELCGAALRRFNSDEVTFSCEDGIEPDTLHSLISRAPDEMLPPDNLAEGVYVSDDKKLNEDFYSGNPLIISDFLEELVQNTEVGLERNKAKLENMTLQSEQMYFWYGNSRGTDVFGKRIVSSSVVNVIRNRNSKSEQYFRICEGVSHFPLDFIENDLIESKLVHSIRIPEKAKRILCFSPTVAATLIYLFIASLNIKSQAPVDSQNYPSLSNALTIVENSPANHTLISAVDHKGRMRKPSSIILNGQVANPHPNSEHSGVLYSSSSACRGNHRELPQIKPTSLSVLGNSTYNHLTKSYGDFVMINNLVGVEQSFNPFTTDFSAVAKVTYCSNDNEYCVIETIPFNSSIVELFSKIDSIDSDGEYGLDGSIICGHLFVINDGLLKI